MSTPKMELTGEEIKALKDSVTAEVKAEYADEVKSLTEKAVAQEAEIANLTKAVNDKIRKDAYGGRFIQASGKLKNDDYYRFAMGVFAKGAYEAKGVHDVQERVNSAVKAFHEKKGNAISDFMLNSKALSEENYVDGGFLLQPALDSTIIPPLVNKTWLMEGQPDVKPLPIAGLKIPVATEVPTPGTLPKHGIPAISNFKFGNLILTPKRIAVMTIINDMIMEESPTNVGSFVYSELERQMTIKINSQGLYGSGIDDEVLGIYPQLLAAGRNFNSNGDTVEAINKDFSTMLEYLEGENVLLNRFRWLFRSRVKNYIRQKTTSTGDLAYIAKEIINGDVYGYPYSTTNMIPNPSNVTQIFGLNFADIIVGMTGGIKLEFTYHGSYSDGNGNTIVGAETLQSPIRANLLWDTKLRYDKAGVVVESVDYVA